jgi:hypothetical protein
MTSWSDSSPSRRVRQGEGLQPEATSVVRRLTAWLLVAVVVVGVAVGAVVGALQSPKLVLSGSKTYRLLLQAMDRTTNARSFVYRRVQVYRGKHPYVFHLTLIDDGPRQFETVQSYGRISFVVIVQGSRAFETAAGFYFGVGTRKADIARAIKELTGKYLEMTPHSLSLTDIGPFVALNLVKSGIEKQDLLVSRVGSSFRYTDEGPFSGAITVGGGRVEKLTLNLPEVSNVYDFTKFDQQIPIEPPSPSAIVMRNPVTGCIEGITYICVR